MNIAAMTILAATVAVGVQVRGAGRTEAKSVCVCVENAVGFNVLPLAQQTASKMFAEPA